MPTENQNMLYIQIKNYLLDLIRDNRDVENFRLPSENQLAAKFHTSRLTVKNAIDILVKKGLVIRYQGKGSFVRSDKPNELISAGNKTVLCIVPHTSSRFMSEIISGITERCRANNLLCYIYTTNNLQEVESVALQSLAQNNISGVIIYPANSEMHNRDLIRLMLDHFPLVTVDRNLRNIDIPCVLTDHYHMIHNCIEQLFAEGYHNIALIQPEKGSTSTTQRTQGYQDAFSEHMLPTDLSSLLYLPYQYFSNAAPSMFAEMKELFNNFLNSHPDTNCIIIAGNYCSLALYEALNQNGRLSKTHVVLIDNDYPELFPILFPSFQTIQQNGALIGETAANMLLERIRRPNTSSQIVYIPSEMLVV